MTATADVSLIEQRQTLRRQLLEQRQRLAQQLGPATGVRSGFPRSMTMRFLTLHPILATRLLVGVANLVRTKK